MPNVSTLYLICHDCLPCGSIYLNKYGEQTVAYILHPMPVWAPGATGASTAGHMVAPGHLLSHPRICDTSIVLLEAFYAMVIFSCNAISNGLIEVHFPVGDQKSKAK